LSGVLGVGFGVPAQTPQTPIPNPQSPIPNHLQENIKIKYKN